MRFLISTKNPSGVTRAILRREAERRGHDLTVIHPDFPHTTENTVEELVKNATGYDLFHYMGGLNNSVATRLDERLCQMNIATVNGKSRIPALYANKLFQTIRFSEADIPVPKFLSGTNVPFDEVEKQLGLPFVAKQLVSSHGQGVFLVQSSADMNKLPADEEILYQSYLPNDGDFRVHVAGGSQVFTPFKRTPKPGDFRANVSQGGTMSAITDKKEYEILTDLALRAAQAIGLDICGIDIIKHQETGHYYVIESNSNPGWKDSDTISGESYASPVIDLYETLVNKMKKQSRIR